MKPSVIFKMSTWNLLFLTWREICKNIKASSKRVFPVERVNKYLRQERNRQGANLCPIVYIRARNKLQSIYVDK